MAAIIPAGIEWTTGRVDVTIPANTLVVVIGSTDADYTQHVTIDDGSDEPPVLKGVGQGHKPMKTADGVQYLQFEPHPSERVIGLSFYYVKRAGSSAWQSPKASHPTPSKHHGVEMTTIGTEDSIDSSFHDTFVTISFYPKGTN